VKTLQNDIALMFARRGFLNEDERATLGFLGQSSDRALTILSLSSLTSASSSAPVVRSFSLRLVVLGATLQSFTCVGTPEKGKGCKALVTGGAVFIGSHLVENPLARGWQVAVPDDF